MGKKAKKPTNLIKPFVSICTPTFNRRPFIPAMIECFTHQKYPKDRMEWIIIDDGTDKIGDLVKDIPQVKYFAYDEQMVLGRKRNLMHEKASGDILVYMDDDDYYPPERVSHAVEMLVTHPKALCAGSSELHIYFKHIDKMYQFGPYGLKHSTAGTFAFKKELLKDHAYDDDHALGEEKHFLKDYTVPFVQLEPKKTILVFSHIHNTFDKKILLENQSNQKFVKESRYTVSEFIREDKLKEFYLNVDRELENYDFGKPEMKPIVLEQTKMITEKRRELEEKARTQHEQQTTTTTTQDNTKIVIEQDGKKIELNNKQIVQLLKQQQELIQNLHKELKTNAQIIARHEETIELLSKKDNIGSFEFLDTLSEEDQTVIEQINQIN